jgi:hypothetical protein
MTVSTAIVRGCVKNSAILSTTVCMIQYAAAKDQLLAVEIIDVVRQICSAKIDSTAKKISLVD